MNSYSFGSAISGLWREKWINFLCVLTIATGFFLVASAILFVHNVKNMANRLPDRFSITVFLKDGLTTEQANGIVSKVKGYSAVDGARYISKDEALTELKSVMKDSDYVLEGLDVNPLPASVEVSLRRSSVTGKSVSALAEEIGKIEGIDDVQYGKELLGTIEIVKKSSEAISSFIIVLLGAGLVFVCYATVKILIYRKKAEMDTLKLLGATSWFIRLPFLIEGGALGLAGGLISVAGMLALYYTVYFRLTSYLTVMKSLSIPVEVIYAMPPAGLVVGIVGAYIAVGRIRF